MAAQAVQGVLMNQKGRMKMAGTVVIVAYANCGCGFRTTDTEEAYKHVRSTGHRMDVRGAVEPRA